MEKNWFIIIPVIVAVIALIIFLVIQNKKDEKALMQYLIDEDNIALSKKHDSEPESED